jgi:hypothetical protein
MTFVFIKFLKWLSCLMLCIQFCWVVHLFWAYVPLANPAFVSMDSVWEVLFPFHSHWTCSVLWIFCVQFSLFLFFTWNGKTTKTDSNVSIMGTRQMCSQSSPVFGEVFWGYRWGFFWQLVCESFSWTRLGWAICLFGLSSYLFPIEFLSYAWGFDFVACGVGFVALSLKIGTKLGWRDFITPLSLLPVEKAYALGFCLFSALLGGTASLVTKINPVEWVGFVHVICYGFAHLALLTIFRGLVFNLFFGLKASRPDMFLAIVIFWLVPSFLFFVINKYLFRHVTEVGVSIVAGVGRSGFVQGLRFCRENGVFDAILATTAVVTLGVNLGNEYSKTYGQPSSETSGGPNVQSSETASQTGPTPRVMPAPRSFIEQVFSTQGKPSKSFYKFLRFFLNLLENVHGTIGQDFVSRFFFL